MVLTCPLMPETLVLHSTKLSGFHLQFPCEFRRFEFPHLKHFGVVRTAAELKVLPAQLVRSSMAGNLKGWWGQKREELALQQRESSRLFYIPSPLEKIETPDAFDERSARAKHCTEEGVKAGFKAASIACIASAVPTLTVVRTIPWFKANLNYTGQALVISAATIATYFIVADQTIHKCSRQGSYDALVKRRSGAP